MIDTIKYIGKKVKIELDNGYFYIGIVKDADNNSLSMIDRDGKHIFVKSDKINFIVEVRE